MQGGAVFLGGSGIDFSAGKPFTALGFRAVIGFGVREVIGWIAGVTTSMFPASAEANTQSTPVNKSMFPASADANHQSKVVRSNGRKKGRPKIIVDNPHP